MSAAVNVFDAKLYYRVKHPEFDEGRVYRAIAYFDFGESAWAKLLFVNERGMSYSVKSFRCFCVNEVDGALTPTSDPIGSPHVAEAPWPKPRCKNPDLDDDM